MPKVLDHGSIDIVTSSDNIDLNVVNSARVSFNVCHETLKDGDDKLINYLVRNKHDSPLRHSHITFRIKAPEFVMRQWYKHVVGATFTPTGFTENDHAWNEVSGRYVEYKDEFYTPDKARMQSKNNKQCSTDVSIEDEESAINIFKEVNKKAWENYNLLLSKGVSREQARMVLPLSFYTEVIWTASLQAVLNFISLRDHPHSQHEIREYATIMKEMVREIAPITMEAWNKHRV